MWNLLYSPPPPPPSTPLLSSALCAVIQHKTKAFHLLLSDIWWENSMFESKIEIKIKFFSFQQLGTAIFILDYHIHR